MKVGLVEHRWIKKDQSPRTPQTDTLDLACERKRKKPEQQKTRPDSNIKKNKRDEGRLRA